MAAPAFYLSLTLVQRKPIKFNKYTALVSLRIAKKKRTALFIDPAPYPVPNHSQTPCPNTSSQPYKAKPLLKM